VDGGDDVGRDRRQCGVRGAETAPDELDAVRLDDVTLVVRAREGDVRAYEQLVRRYQGRFFASRYGCSLKGGWPEGVYRSPGTWE
jgi:hypothetical protein